MKKLLGQELEDADKNLGRSYYEIFQDKVRALFDFNQKYKLKKVDITNDLSKIFTRDEYGNFNFEYVLWVTYEDITSVLRPEIRVEISIENIDQEYEDFKTRLQN